jgi:hypothetical protein
MIARARLSAISFYLKVVEDKRLDTSNIPVQGTDMSNARNKVHATYADVIKNKTYVAKVSTCVAKVPGKLNMIRSNNILSRDHSLERIQ